MSNRRIWLIFDRNLLPDQCFDDRNFDSIRKDVRFFDGATVPDPSSANDENNAPSSQGLGAKRQRLFKVLQRSKSQVGEKLYWWLVSLHRHKGSEEC